LYGVFLSQSTGTADPHRMTNDISAQAGVPSARPAVHILVVEDEALVSSYIRQVLEESGFEVIGVASSGTEALSLAGGAPIHLALVDIRLAGPMDGIEAARLLRAHFGIRSIFLSGLVDAATLQRAKLAEPLGFLEKPFRPSQVFNALEEAVRKLPH
jgi:two-component system, response regulator PdtaR